MDLIDIIYIIDEDLLKLFVIYYDYISLLITCKKLYKLLKLSACYQIISLKKDIEPYIAARMLIKKNNVRGIGVLYRLYGLNKKIVLQYECSVFRYAVKYNRIEIINFLISFFDLTKKEILVNRSSVIRLCARYGHYVLLCILHDKFKFNRSDIIRKNNDALTQAAIKGNVNIIILLSKIGLNIKDLYINEDEPIFEATYEGHLNMLKTFIVHFGHFELDDSMLFTAINRKHYDIVKFFIEEYNFERILYNPFKTSFKINKYIIKYNLKYRKH